MPIKFKPNYVITANIANSLLQIESVKEKIIHLPLTPIVLASLRETARLYTTHYSTMIEGNALTPMQITEVLKHAGHFPGRERDEYEVKGYYAALTYVEQCAPQRVKITEKIIQMLHACIFQSKPSSDSNLNRAVIPIQTEQQFQSKPGSDSNPNRAVIPIQTGQ